MQLVTHAARVARTVARIAASMEPCTDILFPPNSDWTDCGATLKKDTALSSKSTRLRGNTPKSQLREPQIASLVLLQGDAP